MKHVDFNSSSILVKDIMTQALISVNITTPAFQIAKMMELAEIGAVLVKEDGTHVGIITDRDFATKIAANNFPFDTPVEKIMSSPLITINYRERISIAAKMMIDKKVRKLAVAKKGKIVGLITTTDLVNQLAMGINN
jgi:CBS domain-containing protein